MPTDVPTRRTANDLERTADHAGLLHRVRARHEAGDARQAAQDAERRTRPRHRPRLAARQAAPLNKLGVRIEFRAVA